LQGICPCGWHLPSDAEWQQLEDYLIANGYNYDGTTTGNKIAKSLAAKIHWQTSSNIGAIGNDLSANNSSGFSALPGGCRNYYRIFEGIGQHGYWWSSTELSSNIAFNWHLGRDISGLYSGYYFKAYGFSVRCVRDN
jgi:uncharacterized protein (TIGR02145 family)